MKLGCTRHTSSITWELRVSMDPSLWRRLMSKPTEYGVTQHLGTAVTNIEQDDDGFQITTKDSDHHATYVVLVTGADRDIAEQSGCEFTESGTVSVNLSMETSIENAHATGTMVRDQEWHAVISAGDGGAAALDILSKERHGHFYDFDTPADAE
jgi:thioredoxin reductase (NADPH)